jgi:hypothetical protein
MHHTRSISFWLAIFAVIAFAVGTLPTFHGLFCWAIGTGFLVGLRYMSKHEEHVLLRGEIHRLGGRIAELEGELDKH